MTTTAMPKAPTVLWWLLIGLVAVVFLLGRIFWPKKETPPGNQKPPVATLARPERVIETTAPVGRWSENFSVPTLHWFRIVPEGKIRIRLWDDREFDDEPGKDNWLGDDIRAGNFRFRSREKDDVKVTILMRPK